MSSDTALLCRASERVCELLDRGLKPHEVADALYAEYSGSVATAVLITKTRLMRVEAATLENVTKEVLKRGSL